jgi:cytochrome c biogenesis protein CcmG/thiol:disulfide interchange protein DsbE
MTIRQQWLAVLGIVAVLGAGLWAGTHLLGDEFYEVRVGTEAPGFNAVDIMHSDTELKTLSDYRGQVILLNIWATWCEPCKQEMPSMEQLHRALKDRGLAVVAVSVDKPDMAATIRQFVADYDLTFAVLYDPADLFRAVYRYTGVPETYIIDRTGVIRRKWIGPDDWSSASNRRFIEGLLGAAPQVEIQEGEADARPATPTN